MNMARTGKIARLPRVIREQVNAKLNDGATGPQIVEWLNAQPKVQSVLQTLFGGRPVNRQNVCNWRKGVRVNQTSLTSRQGKSG
jgi:hypothetical protein